MKRCDWVTQDKIYQDYHDQVWGRPVTDSQQLFAKLCLDGQQAGLSWLTILKKQANYEQVFHQFLPAKIVAMSEFEFNAALQNPGIIRNKLKLASIVKNAKAYLAMEQKGINFSDFIWDVVGQKTVINGWKIHKDLPTSTAMSDMLSKRLKQAGFNFVGTTICYAFMQAVGLVNDHLVDCDCYQQCCELART